MPLLETEGLRKTFTARRTLIEAVRGVDLTVAPGEIFGFLGPNGSGKTTTLRMLTTLLPPSGSQATVAGVDLLREPARVRERIGYASQTGGVDESATEREHQLLQAALCGLDGATVRARVAELLDQFELTSVGDRTTGTYSGGKQCRLARPVHVAFRAFPRRPVAPTEPDAVSASAVANQDAGASA